MLTAHSLTGAVVLLSLSQAAVDTVVVPCALQQPNFATDSRLLSHSELPRPEPAPPHSSLARPAALAALCLRNEQSPVTRQQLGTQPAARELELGQRSTL